MNSDIKSIDTVILCGGMGKRLRGLVDDRPKPMADINGRPFLDIILDYMASFGCRRFILFAGYMAESITDYYKSATKKDSEIIISVEKKPLGTAGAIKNSRSFIKSNPFFALNGDSICKIDLKGFLAFHSDKKALASVALTRARNKKRFGSVSLDRDNLVTRFSEKSDSDNERPLINAGIYIFDKSVLDFIPDGTPYSLEYDLFNKLNRFYGYITDKPLIDIGTPEDYLKAKEVL
jgi:NDP-sugar pyrophosphorylase family protein